MPRHFAATAPVFVILVLVVVGWSADPPVPQSEAAKAAKEKHDEQLQKAAAEYEKAAAAARKEYLEDLANAQKVATKAEKLDEAIRIRDLRAVLEKEKESPPPTKGTPREGVYTFRGSQYRIVLAAGSWSEAREKCQKMGGDLAVVDTKEKREFFGQVNGSLELWVGGSQDKDGKWKWVTGEPMAAEGWAKGRPANAGPYASLFPKESLLYDYKPDHRFVSGFICEWKK
jgi:hypothetical protein